MTNIFREIRDLSRFFWKTPKEEKALVFYAEHEGYYPYFEGIIDSLITNHNQMLCYVTSDPNDPILQTSEPLIKPFYINKLLSSFMTLVDSKVFVMTLSDLNQFHLKRSRHPVHYLYVFHSLVSTHMMYRAGAFDYYDTILCVGQHHINEIQKYEKDKELPKKQLIEAGYYRLERIYQANKKFQSNKISTKTRKTILIAPSWGEDNLLKQSGEQIIELLLQKGYEIIVRPHPETVRRDPDLINLLNTKFGKSSNFILETSVSTDDSILRSDVLICDLSGIALEYAFGTERPVIFLDGPIKIKNEQYEELGIEPLELSLRSKIGKIVSPENIDNIPCILDELILKIETYKDRIIECRDQHVSNFGNSSEIGAKSICELL